MSHLAVRIRLIRDQTHTVGSRVCISDLQNLKILNMVLPLSERGRHLEVIPLNFDVTNLINFRFLVCCSKVGTSR